jgi:thiol-disulfide isomerase/thioredoxin
MTRKNIFRTLAILLVGSGAALFAQEQPGVAPPVKAAALQTTGGTAAAANNTQAESQKKLLGLQAKANAGGEEAQQELEQFLQELDADPQTRVLAEQHRFQNFLRTALTNLKSGQGITDFKSGLKSWIKKGTIAPHAILRRAVSIVQHQIEPQTGNTGFLDQFVDEFIAFVKSPESGLTDEVQKKSVMLLEAALRVAAGKDLHLYGKTIDDNDFDWESLRGKYVVVKFTATWCGPCKREIPGLISAYEKYKDKGLEIVSVYVWERGEDAQANADRVKEFSKTEGISWQIISEALTEKAGQPKQGDFYGISGVPTMVLIDKTGHVIDTSARGEKLQTKLAEIFAEK